MTKQHKYGQHYTPEILTDKYKNIFENVKSKNLTIVDPFVGEGNLLIDYLKIFSHEEAISLLKSKKIKGFDIDSETIERLKQKFKIKFNLEDDLLAEIFVQNNSLLNNLCDDKDFIITNPPYLARNTCKRKYPEEFKLNFENNDLSDYYELSLQIYKKNNGIWIIPANFISSDFLANTRVELLENKNISDIYIFENPIFENTDISVISFLMKDKEVEQSSFNIEFVRFDFKNKKEITFTKNIDVDKKGYICSEWKELTSYDNALLTQGLLREDIISGDIKINVINEDYEIESLNVDEDTYNKFKNNILYLRTTDTGTEKGVLGLYTLEELYKKEYHSVDDKPITLITKISSRLYTPIFFKENVSLEVQLKIKNEVNDLLKKYRDKYNSIFLTNFKNATKVMPRKRITFKEIYGLIGVIYKDLS